MTDKAVMVGRWKGDFWPEGIILHKVTLANTNNHTTWTSGQVLEPRGSKKKLTKEYFFLTPSQENL